MSNFIKKIVATESTLSSRATQMAKQAETASQQLILSLQAEIDKRELRKAELSDFAPDTKDSLRPSAGKGWDATAWVTELHKIDFELYNLKVELAIAQQAHTEWFAEDGEAPAAE